MKTSEIRETFRYHPPSERVATMHRLIQDEIIGTTESIADLIPQSRERSLFITKMQDAKHWANAALAIHGPAADE